MKKIVIPFLFAFALAANADVPLQTAAQKAGQVIEIAESIAVGRITSVEMTIQRMGSVENGRTLWSLVKSMQTQGTLPANASDWSELRRIASQQDMTTSQVLTSLKAASSSHVALSRSTYAQFFSAKSAVKTAAPVADFGAPAAEFATDYVPKTTEGANYRNQLLAAGTRSSESELAKMGRLLQIAERETPELCSTSTRAFCADAAPAAVERLVARHMVGDEQFVADALRNFPGEAKKYKEEDVVSGLKWVAGAETEAIPGDLKQCFWGARSNAVY